MIVYKFMNSELSKLVKNETITNKRPERFKTRWCEIFGIDSEPIKCYTVIDGSPLEELTTFNMEMVGDINPKNYLVKLDVPDNLILTTMSLEHYLRISEVINRNSIDYLKRMVRNFNILQDSFSTRVALLEDIKPEYIKTIYRQNSDITNPWVECVINNGVLIHKIR